MDKPTLESLIAENQHLRSELESIQQRFGSGERFLQNLSYLFRTPLAVIKTSAYLLTKKTEPSLHRYTTTINQNAVNLQRLLEKLVVILRLEREVAQNSAQFQVNDIATRLKPRIDEFLLLVTGQRQITFELESSLPEVRGNNLFLEDALYELLENAVRFTPENGRVTLRTYRRDEEIVVEVADTGIGIHQDDLPLIFDVFYHGRSAPLLGQSGAGLGLAIVKKVVEAHHGRIEVESTLGQGSVYRVILPIVL